VGYTLSGDRKVSEHVSDILSSCARTQPIHEDDEVTRATVLARLLYAAPAWWGFSQVQDKVRIERFIVKSVRIGYLSTNNCDYEELVRGLKTLCYQRLCITTTMYFFPPCWSVARGFVVAAILSIYLSRMIKTTISPEFHLGR